MNKLLLWVAVLLCACNNFSETKKDINQQYRPTKLTITDSAATYYFTITNETNTETEVMGKEIFSNNLSEIGLRYEIKKDSNKQMLITVTFDKIKVVLKNQDKEEEINADNAAISFNPVEKALGKLKGSTVYMRISKNGKLEQIQGYEEIITKVLQDMNIQDNKMKESIENKLSKIIGKDYLKSTLAEAQDIMPDSTINVGDSWTKKTAQVEGEIQLDFTTNYTLTKVENGIATITATAKTEKADTDALQNHLTAITGTHKYIFEIDIATGLVLNNTAVGKLEGTIATAGNEVPLYISTNKKIIGVKIK